MIFFFKLQLVSILCKLSIAWLILHAKNEICSQNNTTSITGYNTYSITLQICPHVPDVIIAGFT